jgi:hypothetical protein
MLVDEVRTHSFIVKIWIEEAGTGTSRGVWRGHITHVPGGERQSVVRLGELSNFIAPYLEEFGIDLGVCRRVQRWLARWSR